MNKLKKVMKCKTYRVGHASCEVKMAQGLPDTFRSRTREVLALETAFEHRGKGYGTTVMHAVCRDADAANTILILTVKPFGNLNGAMNTKLLEQWYASKFGFQRLDETPQGILMARPPGSTPRTGLTLASRIMLNGAL